MRTDLGQVVYYKGGGQIDENHKITKSIYSTAVKSTRSLIIIV